LLRFFNEHAVVRLEESFPSINAAAAWLDHEKAEFIGCWFLLDGDGERLRGDVFRADDDYRYHPSWVAENMLPAFFGVVKNVGVNPRVREAVARAIRPAARLDERSEIHFDAPGGPLVAPCANLQRLVENLRMWSVTADEEGLFRVNPRGQRIPAKVIVAGELVPFGAIVEAMEAAPESKLPPVREMSRYARRNAARARRP
jgi:hypothetical protein